MATRELNLTKLYYKIGEVSRIIGVKPYVLRYWESEFGLRLEKSQSNQRVYQRKDIEMFLKIKELLYQERYTIAGAKQRLKALRAEARQGASAADPDPMVRSTVATIRTEIESLRDGLHTEQ